MRWFLTRVVTIALPVVEVLLLVWVGNTIGWNWTLVLLLAGLGLGLALMRVAGVNAFRAIAEPIRNHQPFVEVDPVTGTRQTVHPGTQPTQDEITAAGAQLRASGLLFVAGLLFAIPGFLSDLAGAVLALPAVRHWVAARMPARAKQGTVIRGETVVVDPAGTVVVQTWESAPRTDGPPRAIAGQVLPPRKQE